MQYNDLTLLTRQSLDVKRRPNHIRRRLGRNLGNLVAKRVATQQCGTEHAVDEKILDQAAGVFADPDPYHGAAGGKVVSKRSQTKSRLGGMKGSEIQKNRPDRVYR